MSRIWSALPERDPLDPMAPPIPPAACWWRHPLRAKLDDDHQMIIRTDSTTDYREARLMCFEFWDGLDDQLIVGVDVFRVRYVSDGARSHIDVLALDVPTRSAGWRNITDPCDWHYPGNHDGVAIPPTVFVGVPFPFALHPSGYVSPTD